MILQLDFFAVLFPPVVAFCRAALGTVSRWVGAIRDARSLIEVALTCRVRARTRYALEDVREAYRRMSLKLTGNPDL